MQFKEVLTEAKKPKGVSSTRKGIFYFKDYNDAKTFAKEIGWPVDRIIKYELGWAVQKKKSGDYAGPKDMLTEKEVVHGTMYLKALCGDRKSSNVSKDINDVTCPACKKEMQKRGKK